jgi:prephenate dehydrogenase
MALFSKVKTPTYQQLGIIGCGLMGSSFALAMKRAGLVKRIVGYSKSPSTTARALQKGVIDIEAASALQAVSGSDIVLISVPVAAIEGTFKAIKNLITPDMLIMDVGSTKMDVVEAAQRILGTLVGSFVPAHPIAGKELSGVDNADANLYAGRQVIFTPVARTQMAQLNKATSIWKALGCNVQSMSPEAHDAAFAAVSHLPHMLAFALMNSIAEQNRGNDFFGLAGTGFRDFSRIAASDPQMWHDILLANRAQILAQLELYKQSLSHFESSLLANDSKALETMIKNASELRRNWQLDTSMTGDGPNYSNK